MHGLCLVVGVLQVTGLSFLILQPVEPCSGFSYGLKF